MPYKKHYLVAFWEEDVLDEKSGIDLISLLFEAVQKKSFCVMAAGIFVDCWEEEGEGKERTDIPTKIVCSKGWFLRSR